jgi:S-formylglutathione hydrolase FrmB
VHVLNWSLVSGALPAMLTAVGVVAFAFLLLARRDRGWFTRSVPVAVLVASAAVGGVAVLLALWHPFPEPLPVVFWYALEAGLVGVALAIAAARRSGWLRRIGSVLAVLMVLAASVNQVNVHFGQYPTMSSAIGLQPVNQVDFSRLPPPSPDAVAATPGQPLSAAWRPPDGMPATGVVSEVVIPAGTSHFAARPSWVYLPPAYLASPRAVLPVLVLLSGQPGSPRDWIDGGGLATVMDRYAATHAGLSPVVVMPDMLGAQLANPLCMDSRLGNVQTYLTVDVPAWIRATLQVQTDPSGWAVGGYSAGGTCALQLAVNSPQVYPAFLDISGQDEPTLGDRTRTVDSAFGGNAAAFAAVNPMDVLATRRFTATAGAIVAGDHDSTYRPQADHVANQCRRAGMAVDYRQLPGGHDWRVWRPGLETTLPWLAAHLHLTP